MRARWIIDRIGGAFALVSLKNLCRLSIDGGTYTSHKHNSDRRMLLRRMHVSPQYFENEQLDDDGIVGLST